MSKEINDPSEKILPAEKARRMAREAKEKREQAEVELHTQKTEQFRELKDRLRIAGEAMAQRRQELREVQDGLNEIVDIEQEGPLTDDLKELRAELERTKVAFEGKLNEEELAIQGVEADPLYVEMDAAETAAKDEANRLLNQERATLRKNEALERTERTVRNLDAVILEISSAIKVAEKREEDIRSLRKDKEKLKDQMKVPSGQMEVDLGGLLYVLPEKQQHAIAQAVEEARTHGAVIYASEIHDRESRIGYRPAASSMSAWFSAWREKVTPSFLPFVDRPLRALLAFEADPRLDHVRELQVQLQALTEREEAMFADRKNTNIACIEHFLAPDSDVAALDDASLQLLRDVDEKEKVAAREKIQRLAELREKFDIVLVDLGDERYRRYLNSPLPRLSLRL